MKKKKYGIPPNKNNRQNTGKEPMEAQSCQKRKDKRAIRNPHTSIITLHVNGLNLPIRKHRVANWIKKQNPIICCLQETHLSFKDKESERVENDSSSK